jgi:hypothetical protein
VWLFVGIFLTFSFFGAIPGILLIIFFVKSLKADIIKQNNFNDEIEFTAKYYNEDTLNEMK